MTTFKAALALCGLSQQEAAEFLGVSFDTVKKWAQGKNPVPAGVWNMLSDLFRRIEDTADLAAGEIEPDLMDPRAMSQVTADSGPDPLPGSGDYVAGAMALLLAIQDD